ncbi:hypothetical protein AADZ86_09025 [Colwelliaceae bacterium BS250]
MIKNKITIAIAATLLMTSTSALADVCEMQGQNLLEAYQHIPVGELETATGFLPITEWAGGTLPATDTNNILIETPTETVGAYRHGLAEWGQSGWGTVLLVDATQSDQSRPWIAPDGYDGIYIFYDEWRHKHSDGINRIIPCINPGSSYEISADAASKGTLVWSYSYFKTGEETITTVKLTNEVETNNAWANVNETFAIPFDIDVTKDFIVSLTTIGGDEEIHESDVAPIFADNFSLIEKAFESEITEPTSYIPENELDDSTVYPEGWPSGAGYISADEHGNYSPELNGIYITSLENAGIVMVVDPSITADVNKWENCAHARPNADGSSNHEYEDRCLLINWRGSHDAGIARVIEDIVPGGSYVYSVEAASFYSTVLSYSYTKLGASEQTKITITEPVSAANVDWPDIYHWHTMEAEFTAPRDIDVTQPFQLNVSTVGDELIDNDDKRILYANNFSLIEMPVGGDADEDGVSDSADDFPENPAAAKDYDADGKPDDFLAACDETCIADSGLELDDDDDNDTVLDVNDGHPLDDSKNVLISIESATAIAGTTATLDASASIPSLEVADTTYTWEQTVGSFDLTPSGQILTFTSTVSDTKVVAEFSLTVDTPTQTYSELYPVTIYKTPATITTNLVITGRDESNGSTIIETKDDNNEVISSIEYLNVMPGEEIVLDASGATDSEGHNLSYQWTHVKRDWVSAIWSDEDNKANSELRTSPVLTFTVPTWDNDYPESFVLTVTNDEADTGEDSYENTAEQVTVYLNFKRREIPKEIHSSTGDVGSGSFGFIGMILLGGLSLMRRFIKTQK